VTSKLRDLVDRHHAYLGLKLERRKKENAPPGANEYALSYIQPGQVPLFPELEPTNPNNLPLENRHA
jgi:hypothetical protein